MESLLPIAVVILIILTGVNIYLNIKQSQTMDLRNIRKEFDESQKIQNMDLISKISKDSGELKADFIREIGEFKTNLTNRVTEENSKLTLETTKAISNNNEKLNKDINEFKNSLNNQLKTDFKGLNKEIQDNFVKINQKVEERLTEGFKETSKTFQDLLIRITKIDEAQKKIEELSTNIVDLQGVLTDKKTRGIFGEVQLKHVMTAAFGEKNDKLYRMQHTYSNGSMVDCALFAPEPLGTISIDSKFPLENYNRMVDMNLSVPERESARKQFKSDVKKHIDAIATKYIIDGETAETAFMFLPAEAIFAEINAYHYDLVEYSNKKRIVIASPTTILAFVTIVQSQIRESEIHKNAKVMQVELGKLATEFDRFKLRWNKLDKDINTISNDVKDINTTSRKITNRFESIRKVKLPEETLLEDIKPEEE